MLQAGERFDDAIEKALADSKCVIVIWSRRSIASSNVKNEAAYALKLGKLVPVVIGDAELPFKFAELHTIRLEQGGSLATSPEFAALIKSVEYRVGRPGAPAATERKTSSPRPSDEGKRPSRSPRDSRCPNAVSAEAIEKVLKISPFQLFLLHGHLVRVRPNFAEPWRYGCLTRRELTMALPAVCYLDRPLELQGKSVGQTAKALLDALQGIEAEAVDYMPAQLIDLPMHLQDCAFRVLLRRPGYIGDHPFEVTQQDLDFYKAMISSDSAMINKSTGRIERRKLDDAAEYIAEARELAERLGLHFFQ
jgi:hypothetical protein